MKIIFEDFKKYYSYHVSENPIESVTRGVSKNIGLHFGNEAVARHLLDIKGPSSYLYKAYIDDSNFLVMKEDSLTDWGLKDTIYQFKNPLELSDEEFSSLMKSLQRDCTTREEISNFYINLLESKGYNGIKYLNTIEGSKNSSSYIVFDNSTIKNFVDSDKYILNKLKNILDWEMFYPLWNDKEVDFLWFRAYLDDAETALEKSPLFRNVFVRKVYNSDGSGYPIYDFQIKRFYSK